jgi:uncharacterized FlgJ-related protein
MHRVFFISTISFSIFFLINGLITYNIKDHKIEKELLLSSSEVNEIYSEKFIENDFLTISKNNRKNLIGEPNTSNYINEARLDINKDNKIKNKNIKLEIFNKKDLDVSLEFVNKDWKEKFSEKKKSFIETLLPLIAYENQNIILERKRLFNIKNFLESNKTLSDKDIKYLNNISQKYRVVLKNKHKIDILDELLLKVDGIPNSIVLAQAVNESGWGSSRFAREYNALFGQYTYDENDGIIPSKREKGKKHLIKNFSSIDKSIESYFLNINTHYAYDKFRKIRSEIRNEKIKFSLNKLTDTLKSYAADKSYVDTINSIIKSNNFEQFDFKLNTFVDS